jgi:hypothetical protein
MEIESLTKNEEASKELKYPSRGYYWNLLKLSS